MELEHEQFFRCPQCNDEISVLLDLTTGSQEYIEDCETCCRPMHLSYQTDGQTLLAFHALAP